VRIVRGRAEARWLPSRHHFALARLFAFLRMRGAKPQPREGLMLVVDRDQTAAEHHCVSLWIVATVACYIAATLLASWPIAAAFPLAFVLAAVAIEVPVVSIGLLVPARANGTVLMALLVAAAAYFATQRSWVRFAAWQFLAVVALNALAAVIVFLLRGPIARLERSVVSES